MWINANCGYNIKKNGFFWEGIMANIITGIRIACSLSMLICSTFSTCFYAFYIAGGISDVLDGMVARKLGQETKLGAQFDTIADIVFIASVIIKVVNAIYIPTWLIIWIASIALIKCINISDALIIYKRFIPEHTVLNKICGTFIFAIPLCIGQFSMRITLILIILTCSIATLAAFQEGYYIHIGEEIS